MRTTKSIARKYPNSILNTGTIKLTPESLFDAFNKGDKAANEAICHNTDILGEAIGSVVNLFNPDVVIIGGGLADAGREYVKLIRDKVLEYSFKSATRNLRVKAAKLGNNAGWIGAACLFLA